MRALITGGESGLGKAIIEALKVLYPDSSIYNIDGASIKSNSLDNVENSIKEREDLAPFDIVINNYATNHLSWIGETPPIASEEIFHCNVLVPYHIINALASFQKRHKTRIVNIASQTYRVPQRTTALYCASKAALVQMSKVVAREMAPHWQVNTVAPGKILGTKMTELTDKQVTSLRGWFGKDADEYAKSLIPMGRYTDCAEVAKVVMSVLELPDYVTGTVIEVMGGV